VTLRKASTGASPRGTHSRRVHYKFTSSAGGTKSPTAQNRRIAVSVHGITMIATCPEFSSWDLSWSGGKGVQPDELDLEPSSRSLPGELTRHPFGGVLEPLSSLKSQIFPKDGARVSDERPSVHIIEDRQ
jgi:hypothetical protein